MRARIVLTGGPSAGKTTLITLLKTQYGERIAVAHEAAHILFRGGFPRPETSEDRLHTQRSIHTLQRELEAQAMEHALEGPLFCDRGSLDGAAYYHGSLKEFCFAMGSTLDRELMRYSAIIHLQTAEEGFGYTNTLVRTETPEEGARLDRRIGEIWSHHPNYCFIPNSGTFAEKLDRALASVRPFIPAVDEIPAAMRYATASDLFSLV